MKNRFLIAIIGAVFLVCAGVFGFAAWRVLRRPRAGAGLVGRISRNAVVIGTLDLRQVRPWPPALEARGVLTRPPQDATVFQREAAEKYAAFVRNCGIDPWQKFDTVHLAVERSVIEGTDGSALVAFVDGTFVQPDADRCIRWIAAQSQRTIAPSTASGHTVLTPVRQGEPPSGNDTQFTLLGNSVMVTPQRYTPRALAVVTGHAPALAHDAPIQRMMQRLGPTVFLGVAADVAELRARQPRSADDAVGELMRAHPNAPDLALLRQARTGGFGLAVVANNLAATLRLEMPTASNAEALGAACTTVVDARREAAIQMLRQARQAQGIMRATVGATGPMAERFAAIDRGFDTSEQLLRQLTCRAEGNDTVLALTVTAAQITALKDALQAFAAVMEEAQRAPPLGGVLNGGLPGLGGPPLGSPGMLPLPMPRVP